MITVSLSTLSLSRDIRYDDAGIHLHGYEYTPGQLDDKVDYIGVAALNERKPIQSAMRPCEVKKDGTDFAWLKDDLRYRVDGSASHLQDPDYIQKVFVPEFWYKAYYDSPTNKNKVLFSMKKQDGWIRSREWFVARYRTYYNEDGTVSNASGLIPANNKNLIEYNAAAQKTSPDLFVMWFSAYNALAHLIVHDIGRRNAQAVYWGLNSGSTYSKIPNGLTDSLMAPSGEVPATAETASQKPFRWRFIENLWGDAWQMLLGVYCKANEYGVRSVYACNDPYLANTNNTYSGYEELGQIPTAEGFILDVKLPYLFAKSFGASSTTGWCDYSYNNASNNTILFVGGYSGYGSGSPGPFSFSSRTSASYRDVYIGARLASIARLPDGAKRPEDYLPKAL